MQLSLITELYKSETVEKNLIKNLIRLRSNLKYLRAEINTVLGSMYEKNKKLNRLAYTTNKIGYALYWLATLGYIHSRELSQWSTISKDNWHEESLDKGIFSMSKPRSMSDLYHISKTIKSFLKELKVAYSKNLNSNRLSVMLIDNLEYSINELVFDLKTLKNGE